MTLRHDVMQVYSIENSPLCLTGTAEVPLAGIYMDQILSEAQLPIKMVAFGHAFRTEAGASGASSRGLYRVHQFSKVAAQTLIRLLCGSYFHSHFSGAGIPSKSITWSKLRPSGETLCIFSI